MGYLITIDKNQAGRRLDHIIRGLFSEVPLSTIYRWIRTGQVKINRKKSKASYRLELSDNLHLPQKPQLKKLMNIRRYPFKLKELIIFEDEALLAINKPAGIPCQSGSNRPAIIEAVWQYTHLKKDELFRPTLVHRLDQGTSGILLIAKSGPLLRRLQKDFRERQVSKSYLALVKGNLKKKSFILESKLTVAGTYRKGIKKKNKKPIKEKISRTEVKLIDRSKDYSLLQLQLLTGRKHQIRRQLANIGHPLVGDRRYGESKINSLFNKEHYLKRPFLHALSIAIAYPGDKTLTIAAPLPAKLATILKRIDLIDKLPLGQR